jgi:hypothetical protein
VDLRYSQKYIVHILSMKSIGQRGASLTGYLFNYRYFFSVQLHLVRCYSTRQA